jgi:UDP-2-acetamido-2,6-beta-L-arabino-hexul-4-ose reductase
MTRTPVPRRVAITGAAGFLGWHLRCALRMREGWVAIPIDRATFSEPDRLRAAVADADAVVHLAGINRAPEAEVAAGNPALARTLVEALQGSGSRAHLLYANSVHSRDPNLPAASLSVYGRSKREAAGILGEWAARQGSPFTDIRFPHLFGEGGRPHYNSAIATFCHQLAEGEPPRITVDGEVELFHAQRACDLIVDAIEAGRSGPRSPDGERMRISEALARLQAMQADYATGTLPRFHTDLDLELFNTLRASRFPRHYPVALDWRSDARGRLFEAVKTHHGGQCFASWTEPGAVRGNHFHRRKIERFLVASGEALIRVRRLHDTGVHEFRVSGERPVFVDMPTLHTHDIRNVGTAPLFTLFWSHEIFDSAAPDTWSEPV